MADPRARFLITAEDRASKVLKNLRGELGGVSSGLKGLAAQFGLAFGAGAAAKGIIDVALQTEKLRASLETVTGSAAGANAAFDQIKKFTTETPFQVNEVADAFIKLAAYGIEPTDDLLRSLGNTASAMGKTLYQSVEALADATTGQFERLREFGITARSEGDKVSFTFRGVTKEVGKNAEEIRAYLENIGNTDFAGASARQADTLGGAFSNLQDSVFNLTDKFSSESGLTASIKAAALEITNLINRANDGELAVTRFGKGVGIAIGNMQVGGASVAEQRRARIEELEDAEDRLENQIRNKRGKRAAAERQELQQRLDNVRTLIKVLRESLDDPDFQSLNAEGVAGRLPKDTPTIAGPLVPPPSGGTGGYSAGKNKGKSDAEKEAEQFSSALRKLQDDLDPVSAKTRDYLENVALLDRAWSEGQISGEKYDELMAVLATDVDAVAEAERQLADDRAKAYDLIKDLDPGAFYRDQIIEVQRLRDLFPELADTLADVELKLQEVWDEAGQGAADAAKDAKSEWEGIGPIMSSAFEDAIVAGESFKDVLNSLGDDLLRLTTRNLITKPFEQALGGVISGGGISSAFSGLFGFATGGTFTVGGTGGTDSQLVAFRATPGETVEVKTPGQRGGQQVVNNFSFVIPSDTVNYRRTAEQVAREASKLMRNAQGAV